MIEEPKPRDFVRTVCPIYASRQKNSTKLTKIPTGTNGTVRWVGCDDSVIWVFVIFLIEEKKYFARLAPTVIEAYLPA